MPSDRNGHFSKLVRMVTSASPIAAHADDVSLGLECEQCLLGGRTECCRTARRRRSSWGPGTTYGTPSRASEWTTTVPIREYVDLRARALAAQRGLGYREALGEVFRSNPQVKQMYAES